MNFRCIISSIIVLFSLSMYAGESPKTSKTRTIIISGKVADAQSNELLAGVKIVCENSQKSFYSDIEGRFFILLEVTDIQKLELTFSQVGYHLKSLDLKDIAADSGNLLIDLKSE